jgi:endonuclease/exonuclease/phosphatase family metal-dependent hydrolase
VAIIISPHLDNLYYQKIIPLPSSLNGRALCVRLTAKDKSHSFYVLNLYLDAHKSTTRISQLDKLVESLPAYTHFIVGGDFNFVEDKYEDSSSHSSHYDNSTGFIKAWSSFKDHFNLKEVAQQTHTYISNSGDPNSAGTSRLDRFYLSYDEADWATVKPFAYISRVPHSLVNSRKTNSQHKNDFIPSDHLPLSLSFKTFNHDDLSKGDPRIPRWVAKDENFLPFFEQRWRNMAHKLVGLDPFQVLEGIKACAYDAAGDVARANRAKDKKYSDDTTRLTLLLRLLRLQDGVARGQDDLHLDRFIQAHPSLPSSTEDIKFAVDKILEKGGVEQPVHAAGATRVRKRNAIDKIKIILPSTRTRLHALRPSKHEEPSTDPDAMASIAAGYWTRIWAKRVAKDKSTTPERYFGYHQKNISEEFMPAVPTEQDIEDSINQSGKSCAGPDGIPFSIWQSIVKHATPVLHQVVLALSEGALPPAGYNYGLLFLIPKTGSLRAKHTRPISVTNADNRIIAQAVVNAVTPALYATLDWAQKGFISLRVFEDHIRKLNEDFYSAVEDKSDFYVLFMDTAKAFDSVDHDFIIASLRHLGLPRWFIKLVKGLLHDVKVKPAFRGAKDIWISIMRGVKQGCPLSPLLFVICYDILLCKISKIKGVSPYACADDLAVATKDCKQLWKVMELVNDFRSASGLGVNEDKTVILPAKDEDLADAVAGCPWPQVKVADKYKYLGILFGRQVTTHDIYEIAIAKLEDRARRYATAFRSLSHAHRVLAFNVFIITIISYLIKFYLLPYTERALGCAEGRIQQAARRLVIRSATAYKYIHLISPRNITSPCPPLRDAWATSVASLAAQAKLSDWDGRIEAIPDESWANSM